MSSREESKHHADESYDAYGQFFKLRDITFELNINKKLYDAYLESSQGLYILLVVIVEDV